MEIYLGITIGLLLAYANGANDNFKGVATLFGSGTTEYRRALLWATITTALGSLAAILFAKSLLTTFSGKGLVPDVVISMKSFSLAVALAAGATVLLATRFGFPVSTTHALTGALVGAGVLASTRGVNFGKLQNSFLAPLLLSPVLAILGAFLIYPVFRWVRVRLGIQKETCVCVGNEIVGIVPAGVSNAQALAMLPGPSLPVIRSGTEPRCIERYQGSAIGVSAGKALDALHYLSSAIVSFARGLNDTPKIAAILLLSGTFSPAATIAAVGLVIAIGGLISAKGVAETMSHRVTGMNAGQGFTANLITGILVIFASRLGLPVSTTHVSCGALFGIGSVTRQANWKIIREILYAWIATLPVAAVLGAGVFLVLRGVLHL